MEDKLHVEILKFLVHFKVFILLLKCANTVVGKILRHKQLHDYDCFYGFMLLNLV